jgi:Putative MetA-pathway of phenol degradation
MYNSSYLIQTKLHHVDIYYKYYLHLQTMKTKIKQSHRLYQYFLVSVVLSTSNLLITTSGGIAQIDSTEKNKANDLVVKSTSINFINNSQNINAVTPQQNSSISPLTTPKYAQSSEKDQPTPNKDQYNLFNPTPRKLWREFSTGRPDKTENPFTIDAGRFSVEADLFVYTQNIDRASDTLTESASYLVPNLKVGLTNNIDLQVSAGLFNVVKTKVGNQPTQTLSGFGDTTVKLKVNLWGNDGGKTAFGIVPFMKIPTNQNGIGNDSIEGGLILPLAINLSDTWDVGLQTEFDLTKDSSNTKYNVSFANSVSFGHKLSDKWSTYFELYTNTGAEKGFAATFDTGLKYLLTEDIQLDAGVNLGLTEAADAFQPFVGMSIRF